MSFFADALRSFRAPPTQPQVIVADAWQNPLTNLGTRNDKAQHYDFHHPHYSLSLDYERCRTLYNYDPLCRKIVETKPKHMFRRGWDVSVKDAPAEIHTDLSKYAAKILVAKRLYEGMVWGRNFGGAVAILGVKDGQTLDKPLDETRIQSFDFINIQDRRYCMPLRYEADMNSPNFGQPYLYRVLRSISDAYDPNIATDSYYDIHESRLLRFDGATTDIYERTRLGGWSHSVLQAPYEEIKRFMQTFQSASHLLSDASQGVYKLKGLMNQLTSPQGKKLLETRMAMVDMARSVARSLLLDADGEEFQRIQTAFASVPELLDRFMQMLSMVTDIPVTILMGRSAAGMNATGDSDFRAFYADIEAAQISDLEPMLRRVYGLILLARNGPTKGAAKDLDFAFRSLWNPTENERADTNLKQAQADALYVTNEILSPEEVAMSRFRDGKLNLNTTIDLKARAAAQAAGKSFDPAPNDPDDEGDANPDNNSGPRAGE